MVRRIGLQQAKQGGDDVPPLQGHPGLSDASEGTGVPESRGEVGVQDSEHHDGARDTRWRDDRMTGRRSHGRLSALNGVVHQGSCPPRLPTPTAAHVATASGVSHRVTSPRWTSARSYAGQFPTRYLVVYLGCTLDFTSRSCPFGRHDGQGRDEHSFPRTNAATRAGASITSPRPRRISSPRWAATCTGSHAFISGCERARDGRPRGL